MSFLAPLELNKIFSDLELNVFAENKDCFFCCAEMCISRSLSGDNYKNA